MSCRVAAWVLSAFVISACATTTEPEPSAQVDSLAALPRAISSTEKSGVTAGNAFALRLLRETSSRSNGNVLLSPFSVWTAVGLTMNGAAGSTEAGMRTTLGWPSVTRAEINGAYRDLAALLPTLDPQVTFKSANGIWVRQPLTANPDFVSDATNYFGATVASAASPQAMFDAVNLWANAKTDGMVPHALSDAPPDQLVMLLANALVFKGAWRERFDVRDTKAGPFTLESGEQVSVPFMQRHGALRSGSNNQVSIAEIPFGNAAYSMVFIIPTHLSIGDYVSQLDSTRLANDLSVMHTNVGARLIMPRFRVEGSLNLRPALESMGMAAAFSDGAEFPRLFSTGFGAKLDFVQHAVTIDVDEVGARAAAVTVVGVVATSEPEAFSIAKPFVFFIRERFTGALLFAGVMRDPR